MLKVNASGTPKPFRVVQCRQNNEQAVTDEPRTMDILRWYAELIPRSGRLPGTSQT